MLYNIHYNYSTQHCNYNYTVLHDTTLDYTALYDTTMHNTTIHYTNYTTPQLQLQLHYTNCTTLQLQLHYTALQLQLQYATLQLQLQLQLPLQLQLQLHYSTLHPAVVVRWPLQPLQPLQKTQLQPPVSPSVDLLCHPWFTTTNLSYRPIGFLFLKLPPPPCAVLLVESYRSKWPDGFFAARDLILSPKPTGALALHGQHACNLCAPSCLFGSLLSLTAITAGAASLDRKIRIYVATKRKWTEIASLFSVLAKKRPCLKDRWDQIRQ